MTGSHDFLTRFGKLTVLSQSCLIVLTAIIGADTLTLVFYGIFFANRLVLDLILTTVIVIAVGFPLAYFFIGQQVRLAVMAAKLDRIARTDGLTELSNRKTFFEEAQALVDGKLSPAGSLLFIDADHFKSINDNFGHAMGDAVLRELGTIIRSCIREGDLAARLGGEEFAIFLTGANRNQARQVADRIRKRARGISKALDIRGREITVSIGISVHSPGQGLEDILLQADRNLYVAKDHGRDCIVDGGDQIGRGVGLREVDAQGPLPRSVKALQVCVNH